MMLPKVTDHFRNRLKRLFCLLLHSKRTESLEKMLQTQEENFVYTLTAIEKPKREDVPLIGKVCSGKKMCHHDSCN